MSETRYKARYKRGTRSQVKGWGEKSLKYPPEHISRINSARMMKIGTDDLQGESYRSHQSSLLRPAFSLATG